MNSKAKQHPPQRRYARVEAPKHYRGKVRGKTPDDLDLEHRRHRVTGHLPTALPTFIDIFIASAMDRRIMLFRATENFARGCDLMHRVRHRASSQHLYGAPQSVLLLHIL